MPAPDTMRIKAVIFDMDGTLVVSDLDFDAIRAEAGVPEGVPILEYMEGAPEAMRPRVAEILHGHEARAADSCRLRDGAKELLDDLRARGTKVGLLTRNSRASVEKVVERFGLQFDHCITREDAEPKPSPQSILMMAEVFGVRPEETLMVGDYLFDVQAGRAAGARTAFLKRDGGIDPPPADIVIEDLCELRRHVWNEEGIST